jgi:hypothetical protein
MADKADEKRPVKVWHVATGPLDPLTIDIFKIKNDNEAFEIQPRSFLATGIKADVVGSLEGQRWLSSYEQGVLITVLVDGSGLFTIANLSVPANFIYFKSLKQKERPIYDFTKAFIIMSMTAGNKLLDDIRDSIEQGVTEAAEALSMPTVKCFRVDDRKGETYKIDDEIFNNIEESGLIISDLTEEKPNCYFELAWAMAHKRKIIVTAKNGTKIHFDVSRFTIRFWENQRELRQVIKDNAMAIYTEQRLGAKR